MVTETGRVLVVTPATYTLMKQCTDITMETDIGNDLRLKGVISMLDGMDVVRVPASRLPADFGFMIAHPCATVAPTKLESYKAHEDPPGISGSLVEGRITYDAFVHDNKTKAIYYQRGRPAADLRRWHCYRYHQGDRLHHQGQGQQLQVQGGRSRPRGWC